MLEKRPYIMLLENICSVLSSKYIRSACKIEKLIKIEYISLKYAVL